MWSDDKNVISGDTKSVGWQKLELFNFCRLTNFVLPDWILYKNLCFVYVNTPLEWMQMLMSPVFKQNSVQLLAKPYHSLVS
jgi:hypothetical protein